MHSNPKVSVLIHNLNRDSALERCLISTLGQTYRPLEVVILDAGSDDGSLSIIDKFSRSMAEVGIESRKVTCPMMGVAASRNLAAREASGEFLCFIDNDASFSSHDSICRTATTLSGNRRLALVSFRVLCGDSSSLDPRAWVFRRSKAGWSERRFKTFTFAGAGFCIRAKAFNEAGGFWDHLTYSREEEELGLALMDKGWEIEYFPQVSIRHYFDRRGRAGNLDRRYLELRNGLLIFWRRLPLPLALIAMALRTSSIMIKVLVTERQLPTRVITIILSTLSEWRNGKHRRRPVSFSAVLRYIACHFTPCLPEERQ